MIKKNKIPSERDNDSKFIEVRFTFREIREFYCII